MKALGCQPVESTSLSFKVLVSDVNLHPYNVAAMIRKGNIVDDGAVRPGADVDTVGTNLRRSMLNHQDPQLV